MNKISKAFIVDDEELARKELKQLLSIYDSIEIIGEADNAADTVRMVKELNPDIIFLDIQLPGKTGFEILDDLQTDAEIVFVTAYNSYAIQAFEVNALDYLIKPVYPERLSKTIARINNDEIEVSDTKPLDYEDFIFAKINSRVHFIKIKNIMCIASARDYTEIYTTDGKKTLINKSMAEWEERLPLSHFLRIHRANIINLNFIKEIKESISNSYDVYLKGIEKPFGMSQRYFSKIKKRLQ